MPLTIGTAGHIDHGKTALIKALTGMDTDRLKEEKERGISIDLGFAYFDLPDGTRCGIVDVPGHERFIKNMLAGATGIDLVLFVVAADDGIMPQTREHLEIMHLLRVGRGVFVITKIDLVDKGRVNEVAGEIKGLVKDTCLEGSPIVPVSSLTGEGIEDLKMAIVEEAKEVTPKPEGRFFRLPIDRSFSIKGFGTVVTGTVISGVVKKGDEVYILPEGIKARIRGIQSHYQTIEEVTVGQRAAINLTGISHNDIERGDVLTDLGTDLKSVPIEGVTQALVSFEFLNSVEKPLKNRARLKLHHLTNETIATVVFAPLESPAIFCGGDGMNESSIPFKRAGSKAPSFLTGFTGMSEVKGGERVYGRIRLMQPLVMMRGDRFILRDPSINKTIGGGRVLLPSPILHPLSLKPEVYQILDGDDLPAILTTLLSRVDSFGLDAKAIRFSLNLSGTDMASLIESTKGVVVFGDYVVLKKRVEDVRDRLIQTLGAYHRERPGDIGVEEEHLHRTIKIPQPILQGIMDGLIKEGRVSRRGNLFHLSSHRPMVKGVDKEIEEGVLGLFLGRGIAMLRKGEVFQALPTYKRGDVERVFEGLVKRGILVRVAEDGFLSSETIEMARARFVELIKERGRVKASEFRDALGCGRKLAIEVLEYFDKERFTLRQGEFRTIRDLRLKVQDAD